MSWVKLQTNIISDPKLVMLSDGAFRTYINAMAFSGEHLTDGYIDRDAYAFIRGTNADELVEKGLWEPAPIGGGWVIHNYLEHQESKATVLARREAAARRARKSRQGKKASDHAK